MIKINEIKDYFTGRVSFSENMDYNCAFSFKDHFVTLIPITIECIQDMYKLRKLNNKLAKNNWLFGIAEDGYNISFLLKDWITTNLAPSDSCNGRFHTALITKSEKRFDGVINEFNKIEFAGGIVDLVYPKISALETDGSNKTFLKSKDSYTKRFNVSINDEDFELEYTFVNLKAGENSVDKLFMEKNVQSVLRFNFKETKNINDFEKYYSYALSLFQFCTGRMNVNFDINLYINVKDKNNDLITDEIKVNTRFINSFEDYANDELNFNQVINLSQLGEKVPKIFNTLCNNELSPHILFLPEKNKDKDRIYYTDVSDICVAFEREFEINSKIKEKKQKEKELQNASKKLSAELVEVINSKSDIPKDVKDKALGIISSSLSAYSPSLRDKIIQIYNLYKEDIKEITESTSLTKKYTDEEFFIKIKALTGIRHRVSHCGIFWNDGVEIFEHLKLLIYFNVLSRGGYNTDECKKILYNLFSKRFH